MKEASSPLNRVSVDIILDLQRQQQEADRAKEIKKSELARLRGYSNEPEMEGDDLTLF